MSADTFVAPATLAEGEEKRLALISKQNEIQSQLGDRNRIVDGRRLDGNSYWTWRQSAVIALKHTNNQLRALNAWLKEQRRSRSIEQASDLGIDANDPVSMLRASATLLQRLRVEGVDLDPDEITLCDAIRDYLYRAKGP